MKFMLLLALAALTLALPTGGNAPGAAVELQAEDGAAKYPGALLLGGGIEGCSVDAKGNMYALNATAFVPLADTPARVLLPGVDKTNHFAGSRFTRSLGALVADAVGHQVLCAGDGKDGKPLFVEPGMLQPNDFTVSKDEKRIYLSGMNYEANTGDLWFYDVAANKATKVALPDAATKATFRFNGIELSPDDSTLFVTNAENTANMSAVARAEVLQFAIDPATGVPVYEKVAIDLQAVLTEKGLAPADAKGLKLDGMDPDGMRMDSKGTLFVTLNAFGRVLKWTVGSKPCDASVINLKTIVNPSNLELGGPEGKDLVVIGRCAAEKEKSCVDVFAHDTPGRAFVNLQAGGGNSKRSVESDDY